MNGRTSTNTRRIAAAVIVAMLLFLVGGAINHVVHDKGDKAGAAPAPVKCGNPLHFYRTDVPGNQFGPPVQTTQVDPAKVELHVRRTADPSLVVGHAYAMRFPGYEGLTTDEARTAKTMELMANHQLWCNTIKLMEAKEATATPTMATMEGQYQTLYMVITPGSPVPLIRQAVVDRPTFQVLRFTWADGSQENLKLDCGFQPVAQQEFPGIPPVNAPTPGHPSTPVNPCPPAPAPRGPGCIKDPSDDGHGGNQSRRTQPVADNPPAPIAGAPATPPPPATRPQGTPGGGSGSGGAAKPTAPDNNSDGGQKTTVGNTQPCPLGEGNCT